MVRPKLYDMDSKSIRQMEIFEHIKKNSGWLIIPLTLIAYMIDYDVVHVGNVFPLGFLSPSLNYIIQFVITAISITTVLILFHFGLVCYLATFFYENILFLAIAIVCLCFGVLGLFKGVENIPLKDVGQFWHHASLAYSLWLFSICNNDNEAEMAEA